MKLGYGVVRHHFLRPRRARGVLGDLRVVSAENDEDLNSDRGTVRGDTSSMLGDRGPTVRDESEAGGKRKGIFFLTTLLAPRLG